MKWRAIIILNEQHKLLAQQEELLNDTFGQNWSTLLVPATGWTREEMFDQFVALVKSSEQIPLNDEREELWLKVVFASPVPYLLHCLSKHQGATTENGFANLEVMLFHNDQREKKELPNGKVIYTVAQEGWHLVE